MFFTLAWHQVFCLEGSNYFRINIGKLQFFTNVSAHVAFFWFGGSHILESLTNFIGLKIELINPRGGGFGVV